MADINFNGGAVGTFDTSRHEQYEAYDALPKTLKRVLQNALFDYAAPPQRDRWEMYGARYCVDDIRQADERAIENGRRDGIWEVRIDKDAFTKSVLAIRNRPLRKNRRKGRRP